MGIRRIFFTSLTIIIVVSVGLIILKNNQIIFSEGQPSDVPKEELTEAVTLSRHSLPEDIVFSEDKINIYLFWGDGCGYCERLIGFLESLDSEYSKKYNIYLFEVWNSPDNRQMMSNFAGALGHNVSGVPFLIIGDQTFSGFSQSMEQQIKDAITYEYENRANNHVMRDSAQKQLLEDN